jgi:hypothetical protein
MIHNLPIEIQHKIFYYLRHPNSEILINAFKKNLLNLTYVSHHKIKREIWLELRPSNIGSNVYGSGMYILRNKIPIIEKLLLLG